MNVYLLLFIRSSLCAVVSVDECATLFINE